MRTGIDLKFSNLSFQRNGPTIAVRKYLREDGNITMELTNVIEILNV